MRKILNIGEIMLRLSTRDSLRIEESPCFEAHYGGGEANVAISLANFGHQVSFASKVPDNLLGQAVRKHLSRYQVDTSNLLFGGKRLGTYYLEMGTGLRASNVVYDRSYSSFAQMKELEWTANELFQDVSLLHISGITPALSPQWPALMIQLVKKAKEHNVLINFDINYRGKLWSIDECGEFVREIAPYIDYCSAAKLDAVNFFQISEKPEANLEYYYEEISKVYPNIRILYSTDRKIYDSQHNQLQGNIYVDGTFYQSKEYNINQIIDRVGGGDAFAAGILHGIFEESNPQQTVDFATAASVLKHTVHGDHNQFTIQEVETFLKSNGEIKR